MCTLLELIMLFYVLCRSVKPAGHPYILLISFKIFLLSCLCTFYNNYYFHYYPTHALDTSPAHACKEALLVASNS